VHASGLGDYTIDSVTRVNDPVLVEPPKKKKIMGEKDDEEEEGKKRRRTLKDKEKIVYAPFSNIGNLNYDKNSGYITIPDRHVVYTKMTDDKNRVLNKEAGNEGQSLVREL